MSAIEVSNPGMDDAKFFRASITAMALVLVSGFVLQLSLGRSSFDAPTVVHLHAVTFMGWVVITVSQVWLATAGNFRLHRALGVLAMFWVLAMIVMGTLVTLNAVQTARTPFFFQPQHFLIVNPLNMLAFAGVFAAAIALRHKRDWHARLQMGAFMMLLGPGFGRILPMPFMTPFAFEIATLVPLAFVLVGMVRDLKGHGRVHPAWFVSVGALTAFLVLARLLAFSPVGESVYELAVQGTPLAGSDGLAFPPPPPGMTM